MHIYAYPDAHKGVPQRIWLHPPAHPPSAMNERCKKL
ncbi:hypothetical protein Bacsa_2676 [Phocaeicola salanitronis DSM 18170]|uniref:Uncharacterized protein n=1 Tax=Phocaeicola salanitronis (strain DSM 18170 / JCM 13657 / CCUG 60908 / BL78) TaxID=667015 RepID=F0QZT9_PHOSB|nr:hypothetical protein Bacsa_2676 [Phocaeicola salanitronis DSM 18170]